MRNLRYLYFISLAFAFSSCISLQDTVYFQENEFTQNSSTIIENEYPIYHLQKGDILSVKIKSLEVDNAEFLNIEPRNGFINVNPGALFLNGYSVSENGAIHLPLIGSVIVEGLSLDEARIKIQRLVDEFFTDATAIINLVSFKVSVLGEVNRPGYYYVYNNRLTLLEAISLAGDLRDFADRTEITLLRQREDGSEATILDITDPNVISSPYFYLRPNDVVYIRPLKQKVKRSNLSTLTIVSAVVAVISTGISIYALTQNN